MNLEVFAKEQGDKQAREEQALMGSARYALRRFGKEGWFETLLARAEGLLRSEYRALASRRTSPALAEEVDRFVAQSTRMLEKTKKPTKETLESQARAIAASLSTGAINAAVEAAALDNDTPNTRQQKVWLSMEDNKVRPTHAAAHGQTVPMDHSFDVGGHKLHRPGDTSAPIEEWINCRCLMAVQPIPAAEAVTATLGQYATARTATVTFTDIDPKTYAILVGDEQTGEIDMADTSTETGPEEEQELPPLPEEEKVANTDPVPWHGVLAPEGTLSGDMRRFTAGGLRRRPLPQPLSWQKSNQMGHDSSVVVARIDEEVRVGNEVHATGFFLTSVPEVDEAIGLIAEGGIRGVSIDADDGKMAMVTRDGQSLEALLEGLEDGEALGLDLDDVVTEFSSARICGATLCAIPAFKEAWVALGPPPEGFMDGEDLAEESLEESTEALAAAGLIEMKISEGSWDGSASRFTDEEWKRSCILHLADDLTKSNHKLPIKEPNGDLSRAGVHAAAGRINQVDAPDDKVSAAKSRLRSAYKTLGEDPPENLAAAAFVKTEDGPGWITHPVDTDRLRDYWVSGPGAAKIAWGTPGDFNRCRVNVAEYVKPQHLNGYCANRHYDALGFWPASHKASVREIIASGAPAINFVASVDPPTKAPLDWFENPNLIEPSPIVVTEEGRIFGHLAEWGVCHIGINGLCREAPPSQTDYAYFKTGSYLTEQGMIPVGVLTMETGHADLGLRAKAAMAHYDNTGTQAAYVNIGEDEHGIWVSGVTRAGLTDEQVIAMRASALSGDWRQIGDHIELVAALHVNTPGFPVPHTALAASAGQQTALVAAGIVRRTPQQQEMTVEQIVTATLATIRARDELAALAQQRAKKEMAKLRGGS